MNKTSVIVDEPATSSPSNNVPDGKVYGNTGPNRKARRAHGAAVRKLKKRLAPVIAQRKEIARGLYHKVFAHFQGDKTKVEAWFREDNPMLGGVSPLRMIQLGRGEKLVKIVDQWLAENEAPAAT